MTQFDSLRRAFDTTLFRETGNRVVTLMADYLDAALERQLPVLPVHDPDTLMKEWAAPFSRDGVEDVPGEVERLLESLLKHSNHLHQPRYIGHQVAVPLPLASFFELAHAILNNGMAVYEMGQLQTVMERRVVEFLCDSIEFGSNSDGLLTHGGSLGNLTALLAARQAQAGYDVWTEGQRAPMSVLVSDQAHYSISRAAQVMGWGAAGAWPVTTEPDGCLQRDSLERALISAREAGREVIAVVANACSTAIGSFDPIDTVAEFCQAHGLWLHVDGAHGASLALSRTHGDRLRGIHMADSVVWDLHKMLGLPTLNTAVLFRDGRRSYQAFAQEAAYLFEPIRPDEQWFNIGQRTLECTKRSMSVTAYCMLRILGTGWFEEHIDRLLERTREFVSFLRDTSDFELACEPQANIVCFRYHPVEASPRSLDALQQWLRTELLDQGDFYIVQTRWRDALWLRVTIMNPLTEPHDFSALLESLRRLGRSFAETA